jgi:hypothetical protein
MGEESVCISSMSDMKQKVHIPPIVIALALGVAPPSSSSMSSAPLAGEDRKKRGLSVVFESCNLGFLGVAWGPLCEA